MNPKNPFLIAGYHSPDYFCDRERETSDLMAAVNNDRNVTLVAPRRMGKSGLVKNAFYHLAQQGEYKCAYVDIFGTQCLADFVKAFAAGVFTSFETSFEKVAKAASTFLCGFRPTVTFDALGAQKYSFEVQPSAAEATLAGVFDYLESLKFRTVVALDEFQQVVEYPEKGTEALLRSRIQFLTGHQFIFSGSRQHMMSEMFSSPARPFYQSVSMMFLKPVPLPEYEAFAKRHFEAAGKQIETGVVSAIYERFDGTTWYLQKVLNQLFATKDLVCIEDVDRAVKQIINQNEEAYKDVLYQLTARQRDLLVAVSREGKARQITGMTFVKRYHLASASSVQKSAQALMEKQLLTHHQGIYEVYDKFMSEWLAV